MLVACSMSITHAQDQRFEYIDSSLLNDQDQTLTNNTFNDSGENALQENKDILSDTTLYITEISILPDTVAAWKNNKRFAWAKNLDSLLKIKQQEEMDNYEKSTGEQPYGFFQKLFASGIPQFFFWATAIVFVGFILYRLFISNGIFKRNPAASPVNELPSEEKFETVSDYDKLIQQSLSQADYRLTVRYQFLKTLIHLADKEYIHFSADKTNYQYVQEIQSEKRNEFSSLVLNYEYIWYGNFALNVETYTAIEKKFENFYSKI